MWLPPWLAQRSSDSTLAVVLKERADRGVCGLGLASSGCIAPAAFLWHSRELIVAYYKCIGLRARCNAAGNCGMKPAHKWQLEAA